MADDDLIRRGDAHAVVLLGGSPVGMSERIDALPAQGVKPPATIEDVAHAIYDAMRYEREADTPAWVSGGNSNAQWKARATAHSILAALEPAEAGGVEAHDEQLGVWADELMADLMLNDLMELADYEYSTKVEARQTMIDALRAANTAKVPTPAPVDALVKLRAELIDHGYTHRGKLIGYLDAALAAIRGEQA